VIAIVAILAAILFPVFSGAREKARTAACMSHLKNLGTAVLMYAQDHDERLPLSASVITTPPFFLNWHDILDPYIRDQQIWLCPSTSIPPADTHGKPTSHFGYNASYLNGMRLDFSNYLTAGGVSLGAIAEPSATVLLADARASKERSYCGPDGKYLLPPSQPIADCWGRPDPRHTEGVNVQWIDGHMKWMRPSQFYESQSPVDRYFDLF
jgi:prepilin-type processing-associated H-X9-DG protein